MRRELVALRQAAQRDALLKIKRRAMERRLMEDVKKAGVVKISVGSGEVALDGWICTDVVWWADRYLDLTRAFPTGPSSVDYVYADNVIEHLTLDLGRAALRNCWNALRPGGRIRIATPDLETAARAYLERSDLGTSHLDRHRRFGYQADHWNDLLRITFVYHGHHEGYIYDEASLTEELLRAGFVDIQRQTAGQSNDPEFKGLEQRTEPSDVAMGLILEASRPRQHGVAVAHCGPAAPPVT